MGLVGTEKPALAARDNVLPQGVQEWFAAEAVDDTNFYLKKICKITNIKSKYCFTKTLSLF